MIQFLKNIGVGFGVSFIGSIPLGYLNVIAYRIYESSGTEPLFWYLAGIIVIEAVVIYATLLFAEKLSQNNRLIKFIEAFSIFFMLVLALIFYLQAGQKSEAHLPELAETAFLTGLILSGLNFLQLPFWTGWNLYLLGAGWISPNVPSRYFYLFGTLAGTFAGMLVFVFFLNAMAGRSQVLSAYFLSHVVPFIFVALAGFQAWKFYKKYYA